MSSLNEISIVIPVYNSELSLPLVVDRLQQLSVKQDFKFELILVDDGSRDGSWGVIQALCAQNANVRGFRMMRNYGQHNALLCGIRAANFSVIATMDDDLQNPPEELPRLLDRLEDGFDVVYGTPQEEKHGLLRDFASRITKIVLQKSMGAETARNISAFRVFKTRLRDAFARYNGSYVSIDVLLTWGTRKFAAVKVRHEARAIGASNYTIGRLIAHALNMVTGFSVLPLQFASLVGVTFTLFGAVILIYVLFRYLINGSTVQGFPFLASIIAIFSGAQLFALGIIGEYLARIHVRTMDQPSYTIAESTGSADVGRAVEAKMTSHG